MKIINLKILKKSNIFFLILGVFILGIGLASFIQISYLIIYFICLIALIFFFLSKKRQVKIIAILAIFFIIGIVRYQISIPKVNSSKIQFYNGQKITFVGLVNKDPDIRQDKTLLTIKVQRIENQKGSGQILVSVPIYFKADYGQILEIQCEIKEPPKMKDFNYHEYQARYDIYSVCWHPQQIKILEREKGNFIYRQILTFKAKAKDLINKYLPEPQSSLLSALLLGLKKDMPKEVKDWFSKTGTSHIVAISGLHVIVMIEIVEYLGLSILGLNRSKRFYLALIFVIFFVILTGLSASAIRAAIMGLLLLFAKKIGRTYQLINIIILAAALMLFNNPKLLRWDIGFQLSFLAVFGLLYLTPYFYFLFRKIPDWEKWTMRSYLATTCGAYLFTLPLILYYFGNLSLSAFLVNILILGVLFWLMLFGLIFIIGGLIWSLLASILVWPVWLLSTYVLTVIKFFANIPFFSFNFGRIHWLFLCLFYFVLIFIVIKLNQKYKFIIDNF